jgi:Domain of unknown function (DUF4281)
MLLEPDRVFAIANAAALPGWLALMLSPAGTRWAPLARRFAGRWLPAALAVLYVAMLAAHWRGEGGFGTLAEAQALFNVPGALVAGWVHYLAFDLFVGGWIAARAAEQQLPHGVLVPVLLLTFLFGPAGWLAFVLIQPKATLA